MKFCMINWIKIKIYDLSVSSELNFLKSQTFDFYDVLSDFDDVFEVLVPLYFFDTLEKHFIILYAHVYSSFSGQQNTRDFILPERGCFRKCHHFLILIKSSILSHLSCILLDCLIFNRVAFGVLY